MVMASACIQDQAIKLTLMLISAGRNVFSWDTSDSQRMTMSGPSNANERGHGDNEVSSNLPESGNANLMTEASQRTAVSGVAHAGSDKKSGAQASIGEAVDPTPANTIQSKLFQLWLQLAEGNSLERNSDSVSNPSPSTTNDGGGFATRINDLGAKLTNLSIGRSTASNLGNENGKDSDTNANQLSSLSETGSDDMPVFVLGKMYNHITSPQLIVDIKSKIWLSYRSMFEPIARDPYGPSPLSFIHSMIFSRNLNTLSIGGLTDNDFFTTDVGWGCMIRTSQTLLANAIQKSHVGIANVAVSGNSDTTPLNLPSGIKNENTEILGYSSEFESLNKLDLEDIEPSDESNDDKSIVEEQEKTINLFHDSNASPFSIHNFIKVAGELPLQVKPGQWFGPSAASLSIKRLCDSYQSLPFKVVISETADLYDESILKVISLNSSVLILLPIRLGIDNISSYYYDSLTELLKLDQSVGIAGGKPRSSYYFFGLQGNRKLLYLDPHYPQKSEEMNYGTYHTTKYLILDVNQVDPSMLVGFLIKSENDYKSFKARLIESKNKIIHFHDSEPPKNIPTRKHGGFVNISSDFPSLQDKDEEFIRIGNDEEGDFIDLAGEENEEINVLDANEIMESDEPVEVESIVPVDALEQGVYEKEGNYGN